MKYNRLPTYWVDIYCAGASKEKMVLLLQDYVNEVGLCVTLSEELFIYTDPEKILGSPEKGFKIGLKQYPRFPKPEHEIKRYAKEIAKTIIDYAQAETALIVTPDETIWINDRYEHI